MCRYLFGQMLVVFSFGIQMANKSGLMASSDQPDRVSSVGDHNLSKSHISTKIAFRSPTHFYLKHLVSSGNARGGLHRINILKTIMNDLL